MDQRYDLIVIGGGSAGLTAATIAGRLGARVLLVDKEKLGGDCLHDGCVPSKALIASARLAHHMRRAKEFGIGAVTVKVDARGVMDRIRRVQETIAEHDSVQAMNKVGAEVMFGGARFLDPHAVLIGGETKIEASRFVIATGSVAAPPSIPGLTETGFIDHRGVFALEAIPRRLVVIGGGPIGAELGQALSRLGSSVTIVQRADRLLEREEPAVSAELLRAFEREQIRVLFNASPASVVKRGEEKIVLLKDGTELACDEILVAVGRRPVLESLDLPRAGVATNQKGIIVDEHLQTSTAHIFAAGDCTGGPQFTHFAEHEARIAVRNALFLGSERRSTEILPWVTFTDPEVARVGLTEAEARAKHGDVHAHTWPFERVDRALTEGEPAGFIKVVVDKKERVLGAHVIGHNAGEALGEWVLAMEHSSAIRLPSIAAAIHAYPTITRINRRVADLYFLEHGLPEWLVRLGARFRPKTR